MKYEDINEFQLQYYGGLIEYLLDFKVFIDKYI